MNRMGFKAVQLYEQIGNILQEEEKTVEESNSQFIQTRITAKFNIAKIYSRLVLDQAEDRLKYLIKSLDNYKWIRDFCNECTSKKGIVDTEILVEQKRLCQEMINLLPDKID